MKILQNELVFGLHALRRGGVLYFAFQLGQYSLLFRILQILRPAFEGRLRATPTMAPHRTPMYLLLAGYRGAASAEAAAALSALELTPATDEAFLSWHVASLEGDVADLHAELKPDLHLIWSSQLNHLVKQRLEAERAHAHALGLPAPPSLGLPGPPSRASAAAGGAQPT